MSPNKEPHHFYSPYGPPMLWDEYERLFENAHSGHKMIGEASTWYLFSREAATQILESQPSAKFVVCLRNPVEMAVSLHSQKLFTGHELFGDFEKAWTVNDERLSGKAVGVFGLPEGDVSHMAYRHACSLGSQLEALYEAVPSKQVHVVMLDDVKGDTASIWRGLLRFLQIEDDGRAEFPVHNLASRHRSAFVNRMFILVSKAKQLVGLHRSMGLGARLGRLNSVTERYPQPSMQTRLEVYKSLKEEIQILEGLLGRRFSDWVPKEVGLES